jgi:hypothetical protein
VAGPVRESHDLEGRERPLAALTLGEPGEQQGQLDVLGGAQDGNEIVELEDETDAVASPRRERALRKLRYVGPRDDHLSGRRPIDAGDQVEERGFAGARRAHQRHELSLGHPQIDAVQDGDLQAVPAVDLPHTDHIDHGPVSRRARDLGAHPLILTESPSFKLSAGRATRVSDPDSPSLTINNP